MRTANFDLAKKLKALDYDGEYSEGYASDGELVGEPAWIEYPAPRLDDVAYFLRDKHKISIEPMYSSVLHGWDITAYNMDYNGVDQLCEVYGDDYEDTLEAAVAKAIEIIKNEKQ